jgi:hypothetical protein
MVLVTRRRRNRRGARGQRQGRAGSITKSAGGLVQTVAKGVVPPVVDAVDLDEVLERVDLQAVLERIDMNALLEKVDLNLLLEHVDLDALLERTELGAVMARSGGAIASRTLDVLRSQGVGLDAFIERWTNRLLRRRDPLVATGPPLLVGTTKVSAR